MAKAKFVVDELVQVVEEHENAYFMGAWKVIKVWMTEEGWFIRASQMSSGKTYCFHERSLEKIGTKQGEKNGDVEELGDKGQDLEIGKAVESKSSSMKEKVIKLGKKMVKIDLDRQIEDGFMSADMEICLKRSDFNWSDRGNSPFDVLLNDLEIDGDLREEVKEVRLRVSGWKIDEDFESESEEPVYREEETDCATDYDLDEVPTPDFEDGLG